MMASNCVVIHRKTVTDATRLLLISFLTLYFELLIIRWLPTEIRILAYFTNVTLITCVLGLGLGALIAPYRRIYHPSFYWLLSLMVLLAQGYHGFDIVLPIAYQSDFIWNGLSQRGQGNILQYLALFIFVGVNMALFIPLGTLLGLEFDKHTPLRAYSINIFGAILGIVVFSLFSAFGVAPHWWFALGIALLLLLLPKRLTVFIPAGLALTLALIGAAERDALWSPYYRITTTDIIADGAEIGFQVNVNDDAHQQALDLSGRFDAYEIISDRRKIYDEPYHHGANDEVVVLGAGTGNDVAAALRAGAKSVLAVDIDPVILSLGVARHPEHPYDRTEVSLVVTDARTFLRGTTRKFDKVVFGYLDSHSLFSAMSSLRLDNYIYTREFFREIKQHLKPAGLLSVTFTVHEQWIADRIFGLMRDTFGTPPLVYKVSAASRDMVFMAGTPVREVVGSAPYLSVTGFDVKARVPTDNWPYLYLKRPTIPVNYLIPLLIITFFCAASVFGMASGFRAINYHFFFLGAAFLLVETKAITELAIFLGSTWKTNALVIGAILVMILIANAVAATPLRLPDRFLYSSLILTLIVTYFLPINDLLAWDNWVRDYVVASVLALPLFFAGLVFARHIQREKVPSAALGSNLVGALAGGVLEYSSMMYGLKTLYLLAALLYLAAFYFGIRRVT